MPEPAHSAAAPPSHVWWRTFPDGHVGPVDPRLEPRPGDLAFQPGASLENPEPLDLPGIVDLRETAAAQDVGATAVAPATPSTSQPPHRTTGPTPMTDHSPQPPAPQPPLPTVAQPQASSLIAALVRSAPPTDAPVAPLLDANPPVSPEVPEAYRQAQAYPTPDYPTQAYPGPDQPTQAYQPQGHQPQGYQPQGYQGQPQGYPSPQPQIYPSGYADAEAPTAAWNGYEPAFDRSARTGSFPAAPTPIHSSWRVALGEATRDLPRGTVAFVLAAVVGLTLAGTAIYFVLNRTGRTTTTTTTASASASAAASRSAGAVGTAVPAASIKATASSTGKRDGAVTYVAANTLDGKPQTAWNSSGGGTGITLTFTFAEPVHLSGLTMLDGYQKTNSAGDLWALNSRVKALTVDTDGGSWTWDLTDTKDLQTLNQDLGTTSKVTLTVEDVYPGAKYKDIAISELSFLAAG